MNWYLGALDTYWIEGTLNQCLHQTMPKVDSSGAEEELLKVHVSTISSFTSITRYFVKSQLIDSLAKRAIVGTREARRSKMSKSHFTGVQVNTVWPKPTINGILGHSEDPMKAECPGKFEVKDFSFL